MRTTSALILRVAAGALAAALLVVNAAGAQSTADRPNILWIISEDNGPFLGCYGDSFARTPNLDALAAESLLYENAFANAPVCAPARGTLFTGVYATAMGAHHMRSRNQLPSEIHLFPHYLHATGYYTTNRSKTDYNFTVFPSGVPWDEISAGDYRNRRLGQPFFSVINLGISHESKLHERPVREEYLTKRFELPPYHPDTPEIRSNWVEYYDFIERMDAQVGRVLRELEEHGLSDNTIVFYFSDHGGVLPRSKRFVYDSGTHVPLIIRFPEKFRHLAPAGPGSRTDRLVSFVDFAPTVLSLAGVVVPEILQGRAFLGTQADEPREYVHLFRGRMDERYDNSRAVRDKRYKYIRNYLPHRILGQHLDYLWRMRATRSWQRAYREGRCDAAQRAFWEPRPPEELYDTQSDRWESRNLATNREYRETLERLRRANREHVLRVHDAGFLPESEMVVRGTGKSIYLMARREERYPLEHILETAELASSRDEAQLPELLRRMSDPDPAVRYWAATGCAVLGNRASSARESLEKLLADHTASVRVTAAEALLTMGPHDEAIQTLGREMASQNRWVVLEAVNAADGLGDAARPLRQSLEQVASGSHGNYARNAARWTVESLRK